VRGGGALAALACATLLCAACAAPAPVYVHNRYDYRAFRSRVGTLPEPNYLPFATHAETLPGGERGLVVCRFPDGAFPLTYHVARPTIPTALQDEFQPRSPEEYVRAVERAFARWEEAIGRPVRFVRVGDPERAALRVGLEAALREEGEGLVGGVAGEGGRLCRVVRGVSADRVEIAYEIDSVTLYIADSVGLLTPRQVERIALHEVGHVLGASGQHSPLRGDVMFAVTDDSRVEALSDHDVNTFRALYRTPPGTVYARLDLARERPPVEARRTPPRLDRAVADERFGFEVQLPLGWERIKTPRGWIAVDGVSWDYDASVQVIALRGTAEAYLARQSRAYEARGELDRRETFELDGQPVAHLRSRDDVMAEETFVVGWGEGWVLLVVADSRSVDHAYYEPWFRGVLLSLRATAPPPRGVGAGGRRGSEAPAALPGFLPPE
jgi:hypothetical protein